MYDYQRGNKMAQYDYQCKECKKVITEFRNISKRDIDLPVCNKCGKICKRIMSPSSFIINGYSERNGYSKTGG